MFILHCDYHVMLSPVFVDGGCLTQLFTGPNPMKGRNAFDDFGFSKELQKSRMKLYPLNLIHELSVFSDCRCKLTSQRKVITVCLMKIGILKSRYPTMHYFGIQ